MIDKWRGVVPFFLFVLSFFYVKRTGSTRFQLRIESVCCGCVVVGTRKEPRIENAATEGEREREREREREIQLE